VASNSQPSSVPLGVIIGSVVGVVVLVLALLVWLLTRRRRTRGRRGGMIYELDLSETPCEKEFGDVHTGVAFPEAAYTPFYGVPSSQSSTVALSPAFAPLATSPSSSQAGVYNSL
jgi:hypothetical protein